MFVVKIGCLGIIAFLTCLCTFTNFVRILIYCRVLLVTLLLMSIYATVDVFCNSFKQSHVGLLLHSTVVQLNLVMGPLTQHISISLSIQTVFYHLMIVTDNNMVNCLSVQCDVDLHF